MKIEGINEKRRQIVKTELDSAVCKEKEADSSEAPHAALGSFNCSTS